VYLESLKSIKQSCLASSRLESSSRCVGGKIPGCGAGYRITCAGQIKTEEQEKPANDFPSRGS
jgi:hypothetical protein